eukprot:365243-Chlamydomonas_euryale.AAC.2
MVCWGGGGQGANLSGVTAGLRVGVLVVDGVSRGVRSGDAKPRTLEGCFPREGRVLNLGMKEGERNGGKKVRSNRERGEECRVRVNHMCCNSSGHPGALCRRSIPKTRVTCGLRKWGRMSHFCPY